MTDSSVEEELEIVGWAPATVFPEYTVLVAELSGQAVLFRLVSVVAGGVQCVLPETAIALPERADEVLHFASAESPPAGLVVSASSRCLQILSCFAKSWPLSKSKPD